MMNLLLVSGAADAAIPASPPPGGAAPDPFMTTPRCASVSLRRCFITAESWGGSAARRRAAHRSWRPTPPSTPAGAAWSCPSRRRPPSLPPEELLNAPGSGAAEGSRSKKKRPETGRGPGVLATPHERAAARLNTGHSMGKETIGPRSIFWGLRVGRCCGRATRQRRPALLPTSALPWNSPRGMGTAKLHLG